MIRFTIYFFCIIQSVQIYAQYKVDYMLVNRTPSRFTDTRDIESIYAFSASIDNNTCNFLDDDTLLLIDNFSKQVTFQFHHFYSDEEDTISFGYSSGFNKRNGIVLAKFTPDFSHKHYGKIASSGEALLLDYTINKSKKQIALLVATLGDTLFYDPADRSNYLLTPLAKENGVTFLVILDYQFNAIRVSPVTYSRGNKYFNGASISWVDDAYYLSTQLKFNDSLSLHNNQYIIGDYSSAVHYLKLSEEGNLIWHASTTLADLKPLNKINSFPHKILSEMLGNQDYPYSFFYCIGGDTIINYSNEHLPNNKVVTYISELLADGSVNTLDSIIHIPYSGIPSFGSNFITNNFVHLTGSRSDSICIFRGEHYSFPSDATRVRALRFTGEPLITNDVFPIKRGNSYFSAVSIKNATNSENFAYHNDESLSAIPKPGYFIGDRSVFLTKYDQKLDAVWSRSIRFDNLKAQDYGIGNLSIADNAKFTAIYGVGFEQNGIHPESGSNNFDGGHQYQLLFLDCRPISYFRVKERQHRTYTFENLSHQKTNFTWNFGDGNSSTEKNPEHTFPDTVKVYNVQLITSDECGSDTFSREIYVNTLGLSIMKEDDIILYPNPANHTIYVDWVMAEEYSLTAYDAIGREHILKHTNNTIDISNLMTGVYTLIFSTSSATYTRKIIKK